MTTAPLSRPTAPWAVPAAIVACVVMLALATSVVGIVVSPAVVPLALVGAWRHPSWGVKVPLLLGALALLALVTLWLLDGASTGTTTTVG